MKHSSSQVTRTWLTAYTDIEIIIIQKILNNKTKSEISKELVLSVASVNLRILNIFKKMGVKSGTASFGLISHHFRTTYFSHFDRIINFTMPSHVPKVTAYIKKQESQENDSRVKIDYILKNGGYAFYDKKKIPYTHEHLNAMNFKFLDKVYDRTCKEVGEKLIDTMNLEEMTQKLPPLPTGFGQFNGISYQQIICSNKKRILLLFPKSNHKYIKNEEGKSE